MTLEKQKFLDNLKKLELIVGKDYEKDAVKLMYIELQSCRVETFEQAINNLLKTIRFLPKLIDITEEMKKVSELNRIQINQNTKENKCKKCNGTGYLIYKKKKIDGDRIWWSDYCTICNACYTQKLYDGSKLKDVKHRNNYYMKDPNELGL